jgi:hypothetical protein
MRPPITPGACGGDYTKKSGVDVGYQTGNNWSRRARSRKPLLQWTRIGSGKPDADVFAQVAVEVGGNVTLSWG